MSQYESHFSPYIELYGSSALGPAIPYARGLKMTKLEKREALNISILLYQTWCKYSLIPRPRLAFRRLQYGKAGEGLVSFLT